MLTLNKKITLILLGSLRFPLRSAMISPFPHLPDKSSGTNCRFQLGKAAKPLNNRLGKNLGKVATLDSICLEKKIRKKEMI